MASDLDFLDYSTGTITLTSGSANFTTQGAALNAVGIRPGDDLRVKGWIVTIASITGANSGTLRHAWPQATQTAQPYQIRGTPDSIRLMERARALIDRLNSGNIDALAKLTLTAGNLLYADAPGSLALAPLSNFAKGLLASVDAKAFQTSAGWSAPTFTGPVTFSGGWAAGRSADTVCPTLDFNDLITAGPWSLSGNWLNGPVTGGYTATAEIKERLWTAGCRFTQTVNLSGASVQQHIRVGTGANGSITWSAWKKYLFAEDMPPGWPAAPNAIGAHDSIVTAGNNIAAAATLNLNNATGAFVTVTGNTTINAVTLSAGRSRMVRFTGTPQLTAGANLVGNNAGKNIKVEPGDLALFEGHADGLVTFWLIRASGQPVRSSVAGRNMILNPAFQISQENARNAGTVRGYYLADQWKSEFSGAFGITARLDVNVTSAPNYSRYRARLTVTSPQTTLGASDYAMLMQPIEGNDVHELFWGAAIARPAVLAFNCAAPVGTYAVAIRNGAANRSCVIPFSVTTTATHRQTVAIPATTTGTWSIDANVGLQVSWVFACGTQYQGVEGWQDGNFLSLPGLTNGVAAANNFYIGDVSLHVDPDGAGIAPPFVVPDYADDLRECQRYYVKATPVFYPGPRFTGDGYRTAWHNFPVQMRTVPARSISGSIDGGSTIAIASDAATDLGFNVSHPIGSIGTVTVNGYTANARM